MSSTIDRRIVEMQFDNKQFEKGIGESVKSLGQLKKSLQLDGAADGLKELQRAGKAFTLSGIADSVDAISQRFTTMGIIGMRTLQNIADSAYRAGKRMASALTVQPVKMGFGEYETQINAVQTILANTRTEMKEKGYNEAQSLGVITQKLDELNTYADQTIYNFTEMTRNIGTFTAAGVELDKSVAAIKGMSNLAAISGSTPQQASNAMYQMSQALSSGVVRAMDWNSMVNAGMGGEVFKNALINTARAMNVQVDHTVDKINEKGKLVKETVKMNVDQVIAADGGFKESLQSEWLTADVMIATLNQFSIDLEKTAREMGLYLQDGTLNLEAAKNEILGDLYAQGFTKEQAEEIIELAEMAKGAATEVKTLTQLFSTLNESLQSGWTQSWEYILGDFNEAKAFLTGVSNHFGDMIAASAEARNAMLASWKAMGGRDVLIEGFWDIVTAIENISGAVREVFREFFPPMTAEKLFSITEGLKTLTAGFRAFTENPENIDKLKRGFKGLISVIKVLQKAFSRILGLAAPIGDALWPNLLDGFAKFGDWLYNLQSAIDIDAIFDGIIEWFETLRSKLSNTFSSVNFSWDGIQQIFDDVSSAFAKIKEKIEPYIGNIDWKALGQTLLLLFGFLIAFKIYKGVKGAQSIISSVSETLGEIGDALGGAIGDLGKKLSASKGFARAQGILMLALSLKMAADAVIGIAKLNWEELARGVLGVAALLGGLILASKTMGSVRLKDSLGLIGLAAAVKIIAGVLADLSGISWSGIAKGLVSLTVILGELLIFTKLASGAGNFSAVKLIGLSRAVMIIAESVMQMSSMPFDSMLTGVTALTVILGELLVFNNLARKNSGGFSSTLKIAGIAVAVKILGETLTSLSSMSWEQLKIGLIALTVILGELFLFLQFGLSKLGAGLTDLGVFFTLSDLLRAMGEVLKSMGEMSWEQLRNGIFAITTILAEILIFAKLIGGGKKLPKLASLISLGISLLLFAEALKRLSTLSWEGMKVGITALTVILGELLIFTRLATTSKGVKGFSGVKLIGLALSVILFAEALKRLSTLSWEGMKVGITALTVILGELLIFTRLATTSKGVKGFSGVKLILLATAMNIFASSMAVLGEMSWDGVLKGVLMSGVIMGEMIAFTRLSKKVKLSSLLAILPMVGVMAGMAISLSLIKDVSWEQIAAFSAGISLVMLSLAATMKLMGSMSIAAILKGSLALIVASTALGIAMNILGGLMGNALTSFSQEMYQVGANLAGYSDLVSGLDKGAIDTSIEVIGDLVAVAATVTVTNTAGIEGFATSITRLGGSLNLYSSLIEKVSSEKSQAVRTVVDDVGYVAGKMNELSGGNIDVNSLGLVLGTLGSGLKLYSESLKSVDLTVPTEGTESAVSTGTYIKRAFEDIAENLPTSDVIAQVSACAEGGGDDMVSFGLGLTAIGTAISSFNDSIANVDDAKVTRAGLFVQMMSSIESGLTTHGGAIEWFKGKKQTLNDFSTDIVVIGQAIGTFGESVKDIDDARVTSAGNAITMLSEIQKGLDVEGGVLSWFTGEKSLGQFATELNTLGPALKQFSDNISGIDEDKMSRATVPIDTLVTMQGRLDESGGMGEWFTGSKSLGAFGRDIETLGRNLSEFYKDVSGVAVPDNMDSILSVIETFAGYAERLSGVKDVYDLSDFIKWLGEDISTFFRDKVNGLDTSSAIALGVFINRVADAAAKLQGVEVDRWAISDLLSSLTLPEMPDEAYASVLSQVPGKLEAIVAAVLTYQDDFESAGRTLGGNLGHGMAQGISSMAGRVRSAAISAASGAIHAIQISWAIHSPSRITREFGKNFDFGLIEGIDGYSGMVIDSAQRVAEGAARGFSSSMNLLSGLEEELDYSPHIRPVLDLDDVINGMHTMDGMFASDRRIRGYFNGGISIDGMRGMRQDRKGEPVKHDNRDVVEAIHKLGERFDELSARMDGIQIVLDSGALVGHTSAQMDAKLGALASRRSRGN